MTLTFLDMRKQLVAELKGSYESLFENYQSISHLRGKSVNSVFIEGGIQCLDELTDDWKSLDSYKNIRSDPIIKSKRRIIEGEPGSGKSVLTFTLAHEWSVGGPGSCLNDVDILIIIKLIQLRDVTSIYDCIKQFVLPKESSLTVNNIKEIIQHTSSVLFLLEDVDQYLDYDTRNKNNILDIMNKDMCPHFEVFLTTRSQYVSEKYSKGSKRIRLTGFDRLAQDKYLRKVVTKDDNAAAERIKESLQDNPILGDLCRVPFFFITYAHITYQNDTLQRYTTITGYFRQMMSFFQDHFKRKIDKHSVRNVLDYKPDLQKLSKFAYDSLVGYTNESWNNDHLRNILGKECYDQYLRVGIFVQVIDKKDGSLRGEDARKAKFNHSLFCEWYAAHYLVDVLAKHGIDVDNDSDERLTELLEDLYPSDYQHLYRFVCGIYPEVTKDIIQYMRGMEGSEEYSILCILEQSGNKNFVLKSLKDLCSKPFHLSNVDTKLLHRSTLRILAIASHHKLIIPSLMLHEALKTVDASRNEIVLTSGLRLPIQNNLKQLWIEMTGAEWSSETLSSLFIYACNCEHLNSISDLSVLRKLERKSVKVMWYPTLVYYRLNLQSGRWEHTSSRTQLTEDELEKEIAIFQDMYVSQPV